MNFVLLRNLNLEICAVLKFTKEGRKYKQLAVKFMNVVVVWPYTQISPVHISLKLILNLITETEILENIKVTVQLH